MRPNQKDKIGCVRRGLDRAGRVRRLVWLVQVFRTEPEPNGPMKQSGSNTAPRRGVEPWNPVLDLGSPPAHVSEFDAPGPGGYKSFGLVWEEGREMPVGFTKRVIGFPRVANNCAICHAGTWRSKEGEVPHVVVASPGRHC